ncbi:hypothetical protein BOTBODRAFT_116602, partial [Botryobasidium botryosum FD-172 SS1]
QRLAREAKVWGCLTHPNILPFLGLHHLGSTSYLVSPWMTNGHALAFVKQNADADVPKLLAQVADGLAYLHTFHPQVVHGDLKGANIFISESGDACIADFGLSELKDPTQEPTYSTPWLIAGHPRWQAPELLNAETKEQIRRTTQTDVFAFGRVMLEVLCFHQSATCLFTGVVPFSYIDADMQVARKVQTGQLPDRPCDAAVVEKGFNDAMWELMLACWSTDPLQRPSASSLQIALKARNEK